MSRKTLLTEAEIRSFLKLANLGSIGDARIQEMGGYGMPGGRDEEEEPVEMQEEEEMEMDVEMAPEDDMGGDEMDMEMGADDGEDMDMEMGDDEMGMDAGGGTVDVEDFMAALETALEDVLGEPVSTEMDDEEDDMDADLGDEEAEMGDMGAEMGDEMEMGPEEEPMMQEDVINEVAKRVAARLNKAQSKDAMVDQLAERIMKRLTK